MWNWLKELLDIRQEYYFNKLRLRNESETDRNICQSCEVLKTALERANLEKDKLLRELLTGDIDNPPMMRDDVPLALPKNIPWNVRKQMLEREDRERARILNDAPIPKSTEDLEKELRNAESNRSKSANSTQ